MEETGRKGSREIDRTGENTHTQMAKHEIQTLCSITGQGEDDVVAMLKKYGGDMDAATNALIDMEKFETVAKKGTKKKDAPKPAPQGAKPAGRRERDRPRDGKREERRGGKAAGPGAGKGIPAPKNAAPRPGPPPVAAPAQAPAALVGVVQGM